ncbi:MAG: META domain-containing protein, partial [Muribaculaceae bacterium]|nr:META domain-containing protein [Muribaculaceae bacterium]
MNKPTAIFLSLLVASVSLTGCSSLPDFRKYVPEKIELPKINLKSKKDNQDEKKENSSNEKHVANPTDTTKSATAPKGTQKVTKAEKNKRKVQAKSAQVATQQLRLSEKVLSGKWTIHSVSGHTVTGDDDQWPYIEFDVNTDRFYASNGCNLLNGRFKVESGQQIKMTDIIASRQQCPESEYPDINTQLTNVGSYSLSEKNGEYYLNLHNAKHLTIMVLRKHNTDFLNGPWRVSEINGQKCQNPDVKLVID